MKVLIYKGLVDDLLSGNIEGLEVIDINPKTRGVSELLGANLIQILEPLHKFIDPTEDKELYNLINRELRCRIYSRLAVPLKYLTQENASLIYDKDDKNDWYL